MVEQSIDSIVASKLAELDISGASISRTFAVAQEGAVRNWISEDAECEIEVSTGSRSQDLWEIPYYDIPVRVSYYRRFETDPTGEKYARDSALISACISRYAGRGGAGALRADFTAEGFVPAYFHLDGGENGVDRGERMFTFEQNFAIRGVIH